MLEYILLAKFPGATQADADAASAKATAYASANPQERLEMRVATLELAVETLLRMVMESSKITERQFMQLLQQIDGEDGVIDGRRDLNRLRRECPKCHRNSSASSASCMWCGESLESVEPALFDL